MKCVTCCPEPAVSALRLCSDLLLVSFNDLVPADRAHRIGQANSVNVIFLHAKGSSDDLIWCVRRWEQCVGRQEAMLGVVAHQLHTHLRMQAGNPTESIS